MPLITNLSASALCAKRLNSGNSISFEGYMRVQATINGRSETVDTESIDHIDIPELAEEEDNFDGTVFLKDGRKGTISGYYIFYIQQEEPHLINKAFNFMLWLERKLPKGEPYTLECFIEEWNSEYKR